jgi:hypothetical protein
MNCEYILFHVEIRRPDWLVYFKHFGDLSVNLHTTRQDLDNRLDTKSFCPDVLTDNDNDSNNALNHTRRAGNPR